ASAGTARPPFAPSSDTASRTSFSRRKVLVLGDELPLELRERPIAGQDLGDTGVRFPMLVYSPEELPILQLDSVHRHVYVRNVDLLFLAIDQVVVAGDVRAVVADVSKEGPQGALVVEGQGKRTDRPACALELDRHVHGNAEGRVHWTLHRVGDLHRRAGLVGEQVDRVGRMVP